MPPRLSRIRKSSCKLAGRRDGWTGYKLHPMIEKANSALMIPRNLAAGEGTRALDPKPGKQVLVMFTPSVPSRGRALLCVGMLDQTRARESNRKPGMPRILMERREIPCNEGQATAK
jgi:hypothetical protein